MKKISIYFVTAIGILGCVLAAPSNHDDHHHYEESLLPLLPPPPLHPPPPFLPPPLPYLPPPPPPLLPLFPPLFPPPPSLPPAQPTSPPPPTTKFPQPLGDKEHGKEGSSQYAGQQGGETFDIGGSDSQLDKNKGSSSTLSSSTEEISNVGSYTNDPVTVNFVQEDLNPFEDPIPDPK